METFGPWHPGIESQVPAHLRHLCTIFRPENGFVDIAQAAELQDLTGLDPSELVVFRPERLALHEVLIRVTADLSVPDGTKIEDLGINFRRITRTILARHVEPRNDAVVAVYGALRGGLRALIDAELAPLFPPLAAATASQLAEAGRRTIFRLHRARVHPVATAETVAQRTLATWESDAHATDDAMRKAAYRALGKVLSALLVRHGGLWGSREIVAAIATGIACNDFGADEIGRLISPWLLDAADGEGYVLLPRQELPFVMNTKGPSASGKSTLRPLQKRLAGDIGVNWSDFALISPDIWRKQLLDYGTLGAAYRYGGAFTAEELQIVDQKLDRYMARKAERGNMSHLLIDRFRFDSFAPDSDEAGSNLLTRFGRVVYLFFMITSPESLVERAWKRGLDVGRYKAVDDTLAHAVEAYSGMPQLFFTWIQRTDKRVHFEFLDNSVQLGERPRTVAFGWNDTLNVLDVKCLLDVERYRRVNINARGPEGLYEDRRLLAPERNTAFLRQCVERFREVNFAVQATGRIYVRLAAGKTVWVDRDILQQAAADPDIRAGLLDSVPEVFDPAVRAPAEPVSLPGGSGGGGIHTLGRWGSGDDP
ncbi:MAG TPA: hypothetical protein VGK37_11780 [Casimicrobiaceae bacterium]